VQIKSLTVNNFMPYKGVHTLSFPTDPSRNVMLIMGDNMRGKTSFLNAIRWAFYGRALGRHLRQIPTHQLHNTEAGQEGDWTFEVHIQFESEGHTYDLRRRASKKTLVAKPSSPEDFNVVIGLQKDSMAIRADQIDFEINKIAPEQVSRFFLFDGELLQEYENLLIEGSEQGKKIKKAVEQVLGVPALINGRVELLTILKKAQKQQAKDLSQVHGLERQAEQQAHFQEKQLILSSDIERIEAKLKETEKERLEIEDKLDGLESIYEAKAQLDMLEKRQNSIFIEQEKKQHLRLEAASDVWRDLLSIKLSIKHSQLQTKQKQLTEKTEQKTVVKTKIKQLEKLLNTSECPTCHQKIGEDRREEAGSELGELQGKIRTIEIDHKELMEIAAELAQISAIRSTGAGKRIETIDADLRRLDVELTQVETDAENKRDEIKGHDTAEIARMRSLRDALLKEEANLQKDIDDTQSNIDEISRQLEVLAKLLQDDPAARASKSTAKVRVALALQELFNQSIERLRKDLKGRVEKLATEAFLHLTTQKSYQKLEINDNYGLQIIDDTSQRVEVRSAGAEQIVALSLIDGLSRTGRVDGPVIMDTPFGRLDLKHRENILKYLPNTASQLILLVHDGEIRKETDLEPLNDKIGLEYEIVEVSPRHSAIKRV
jgi:DNA sulfur modification protein DndD